MTLGQSIKYLRGARGMSQVELARSLGISPSYLSLIESDRREASIPLLRNLADALGAPAFLLFAQALAGTRSDLYARQAEQLLDDLTSLVAARGLPLDFGSSPGDRD